MDRWIVFPAFKAFLYFLLMVFDILIYQGKDSMFFLVLFSFWVGLTWITACIEKVYEDSGLKNATKKEKDDGNDTSKKRHIDVVA